MSCLTCGWSDCGTVCRRDSYGVGYAARSARVAELEQMLSTIRELVKQDPVPRGVIQFCIDGILTGSPLPSVRPDESDQGDADEA